MLDSESYVKPGACLRRGYDSESLTPTTDKLSDVAGNSASNRDTVLSEFVRHKIREWTAVPGREQKDLAELAGFASPSQISNAKKGIGVGAKSAPGYAKAFGYSSVEAMVDAAYEWRKGSGEALERRLAEDGFRRGVDAVRAFIAPPATDEEIRAVAADFLEARFDGRDGDYWYKTLGEEIKADRLRDLKAENDRQKLAADRREGAKVIRNAYREASVEKKKLADFDAAKEKQKREAEAAAALERLKHVTKRKRA